jgi:hypothetical protein
MSYTTPTIDDNKIHFYRERLYREVTNLFEWEGLPEEIPLDYLEDSLIRGGRVMFFNAPETYGFMALACTIRGFNTYTKPTHAISISPNTDSMSTTYTRTITYNYTEPLPEGEGCVLINNMYSGQSISEIVEFYAHRLALIQQAFDTNAMWQNVPVVFNVPDNEMKLSIEKLFESIYKGVPWVIVDHLLLAGEKPAQAGLTNIEYRLDKLMDSLHEVYNEFKQAVGINTSGAEKAERLLVDEVQSNNQSTETCLQIMLSQREKACLEIQHQFGLTVTVKVRGQAEESKGNEEEEEIEDGKDDGGIEATDSTD